MLITMRLVCLGATRGRYILYFMRRRVRNEKKRETERGNQKDGR